jgi:hypothetical protein
MKQIKIQLTTTRAVSRTIISFKSNVYIRPIKVNSETHRKHIQTWIAWISQAYGALVRETVGLPWRRMHVSTTCTSPHVDDVHQASKASHGKRKRKRNVRVKSNATRDLDGVQRHAALETHRDRVKCRFSRLQIL